MSITKILSLIITALYCTALFITSANAKINCTQPGAPVISPSSLTCDGGYFSSTFRPKSTSTSTTEVYLQNHQSCNLNFNLSNLVDLQSMSIRSSQIIMLEDDWEKEYTKTNTDCSSGVSVCTGLGFELCHGTTVPGDCISGLCEDDPSVSCSINSNCSKKSIVVMTK